MCVITAYGVQCLVAGCRGSGTGQQAVRPGRGMLHDEVVPVGAELYSADRQTYMTQLIVVFRNTANALKSQSVNVL